MRHSKWFGNLRRNILAGLIAVIPLLVTFWVLRFILEALARVGKPVIGAAAAWVEPASPLLADWLLLPWAQWLLAVFITLAALYGLGFFAKLYMGRKLIALLDWLIERIPLAQTIYGGSKKLLLAMQQKPRNVQRVVFIDFPSPEMKTLGLVTRTFKDRDTGQDLAAVYVPTTPNPTSGYLEIVPVEKVVSTDMTVDEAMTFIITGGAVAPENMNYAKSSRPLDEPPLEEV